MAFDFVKDGVRDFPRRVRRCCQETLIIKNATFCLICLESISFLLCVESSDYAAKHYKGLNLLRRLLKYRLSKICKK